MAPVITPIMLRFLTPSKEFLTTVHMLALDKPATQAAFKNLKSRPRNGKSISLKGIEFKAYGIGFRGLGLW